MKKLRSRETESLVRSWEESGFIPNQLYLVASAMGKRNNINHFKEMQPPLAHVLFTVQALQRYTSLGNAFPSPKII